MYDNQRFVQITIKGLVQGIGFRPFVAECAEELDVEGTVKNTGGIVIAYAHASIKDVDLFVSKIKENKPQGAVITSISIEDIDENKYKDEIIKAGVADNKKFAIDKSLSRSDNIRLLPPDLPTCKTCEEELLDEHNRRYRYPFISCTACGPRFSIMHTVPYDRETTTMDTFKMCPDCLKEYTQKGDIRRHAQTISCHECGPQLYFCDGKEDYHKCNYYPSADNRQSYKNDNESSLTKAIDGLCQGQIGAILDIGGFHFAFSPFFSEPSQRLRIWKNREAKPFAVMFPDIRAIQKYCEVSQKEQELLLSNPRPIVLLKKKSANVRFVTGDDKTGNNDINLSDTSNKALEFADEVLSGSDRIGAMLPCNPLQILLLKATGPLVMTSGNRGGEPIITDPVEMRELLGTGGPDFMLYHDRKILTPLDDSIYQVNGNVVQIIRRARGIVPWPVDLPFNFEKETFAAGGDLKSVFALGKADKAYLSAHFGDLYELEASRARMRAINHMEKLLDINPVAYICDKHPGYVSAKETKKMATRSCDVMYVQHHLSHVMAVAAENDIKGNFVGIAYDGTGYGDDGSIWGSEFFVCNIKADREFTYCHKASLAPVKMLGGDEGAKDAVKTLYCYLYEALNRGYIENSDINLIDKHIKKVFTGHQIPDIRLVGAALDHDINITMSTSMGRLFDAVSSLLGICCYNSYEGECPAKLEICAKTAKKPAELNIDIIRTSSKSKTEKMSKIVETSMIVDKTKIEDESKTEYKTKTEDESKIEYKTKTEDESRIEYKTKTEDKSKTLEIVNTSEIMDPSKACGSEYNQQEFYYLDGVKLVSDICRYLLEGIDSKSLALGFHIALSKASIDMAHILGGADDNLQIAIGGGSFLNRILNTSIQESCKQKGYKLYQNSKVPPGDGGIALGQLYLAACKIINDVS